jgi:hypothetical protein
MPNRNRRAAGSTSNLHTRTGSALRFAASLFFLYVLYVSLSSGIWGTYLIGTQWAPVLIGLAVLGTVSLFFGGLAGMVDERYGTGNKLVYLTAFALVGLTVSTLPSVAFWMSIVGFVIGWLGALSDRKH